MIHHFVFFRDVCAIVRPRNHLRLLHGCRACARANTPCPNLASNLTDLCPSFQASQRISEREIAPM